MRSSPVALYGVLVRLAVLLCSCLWARGFWCRAKNEKMFSALAAHESANGLTDQVVRCARR